MFVTSRSLRSWSFRATDRRRRFVCLAARSDVSAAMVTLAAPVGVLIA